MRHFEIASILGLTLLASNAMAKCGEGFACIVSVTKNQISARFPVANAPDTWPAIWHWNRASTEDNVGEYRWSIAFGDCSSKDDSLQKRPLSLEVSLYKFPGSAEYAGSFEDLMSAAQGNLWRCSSAGGCKSELKLLFTGELGPKYIEIAFRREPAIDALVARKPSVAILSGTGSYCYASVEYK